jgi:beta-galactosidase/beta-glucuronidase
LTVHTLDTGWSVRDFMPGAGLAAGASLPTYATDDGWLAIAVPGDVHRTLIDAGRIPDPFYDRNETACAWMEEREWWYRVEFDVPAASPGDDARQELVFNGLDTFATIYLNGEEIGEHHNMFRPAVVDVTRRLQRGAPNTLSVRFDPPLQRIAGMTRSAWGRNSERTPMRKAQFGYGWDWGPRLPTIGIWREVELRTQHRAALTGIHFTTLDIAPGAARAALAVTVEASAFATSTPLTARVQLTAPDGTTAAEVTLTLEQPSSRPGTASRTEDAADGRQQADAASPPELPEHPSSPPGPPASKENLSAGSKQADAASLSRPTEQLSSLPGPASPTERPVAASERADPASTSRPQPVSSPTMSASPKEPVSSPTMSASPKEKALSVSEPGERATATDVASLTGVAYVTVDQPRLWWTHELGEPALYDLTVTLLEHDAPLDDLHQRVGIRTLTLDQSPDPGERGTRFFRFVLNGVAIFAKGADWIPCESFVGAIPDERYTTLLEAARAANMTMLRIWGGGIYEHDQFYTECDRLGLLVWQDFMFACAMYPEDDPDFVHEVDAEARYQVRRLRSHPSLALWCGNNENQWLHDRAYWDRPTLPAYGALYYDSILPEAVADLDGRTPYWPGSPYGGNDHNSRDEGNVHNWDVWHGNSPRRFGQQPGRVNTPEAVSYRRYTEDLGRFVSEFGMHAAPQATTLWRVIPPEERYEHSPSLDWHNKDNPKNKGDNLLLATTGLPTNLEQYILFSQMAQAEGLKFGIEHYRRRKPHCSGTLVWQLDDCWPVLSWSVLDYYGFPKASYYFLRRVYAPLLASFKPQPGAVAGHGLGQHSGGGLELWLTNDTQRPIVDQVTVRLGTFAGHTRWERTRELSVAPGASACVWTFSADDLTPPATDESTPHPQPPARSVPTPHAPPTTLHGTPHAVSTTHAAPTSRHVTPHTVPTPHAPSTTLAASTTNPTRLADDASPDRDDPTGLADHYLSVRSATGAFPANRHFFAEFKDLVRQPTAPAMRVTRLSPHTARIHLEAPSTGYVYFAHVTSPRESTRFSDNFLDLQPGETYAVDVTDPMHELHPDTLRLAWA